LGVNHESETRPWLGVELRHLAALAAIAEEGTFRAAADRLGYVQSAVSQQIVVLERALGTRVIERTRGSQRVALTEPGQVLLDHFEQILAKFSAAWADVQALDSGRAGVVRLGLAPSVESHVLPAVLPRLAQGSEISVNVTECVDDEARAALAEGRIDAALVSTPARDGPFVDHRLIEDPLVLLVRADAPLARRRGAPSLAEIGAISLIGRRGSSDADAAFQELAARGIEPRIVYESDDDATVHALVAKGVGAAILPALSVDWGDDTVAAVPLDDVLSPRVLSLLWHSDRRLTPALETFCDATIAACRDLQRELDARLAPAPPLAVAPSG
jgi:DNA-binding transcriptional LysR family regulator